VEYTRTRPGLDLDKNCLDLPNHALFDWIVVLLDSLSEYTEYMDSI
jgi:hypothetical protein